MRRITLMRMQCVQKCKEVVRECLKSIKEMDLNFCSDCKFEIEDFVNCSCDCNMRDLF